MTDWASTRITRRAFLSIIAAAGASACTGPILEVRRSPDPATPQPSRTAPSSPASPRSAATRGPTGYEPFDGEVYPNAKRLAGRFAEALTTYDEDARPRQVLRRAVAQADWTFDADRALRTAQPLLQRGAQSRGEVVYPQLGGLVLGSGPDRACVMVVVRQDIVDSDGNTSSVTRTLDVRLINRGSRWRLSGLADAGPRPVERASADLSDAARRVLEDTRIELPDTARWDILTGIIDERLLKTMLDLAGVAPYAVATLKTGHPKNVFGTDRISGHTLGRGVDIWRIAGQPVVLQQPRKETDAYAFTSAALHDLQVPELGSPWDLDGPPKPGEVRPSFTDAVHADHIHVAFKAP